MRWEEQELWRLSALGEEDSIFDPALLCEDGWLTAEELASEENVHTLLQKAVRRGFPADADQDDLAEESALWLKESNTHRIWNDLVDEDMHLRAPPQTLAV